MYKITVLSYLDTKFLPYYRAYYSEWHFEYDKNYHYHSLTFKKEYRNWKNCTSIVLITPSINKLANIC